MRIVCALFSLLSVLGLFGRVASGQSVLHESLVTYSDGPRFPASPLVKGGDGNFYGTTVTGGRYGYGCIFQLTPAGAVTMLWHFGEAKDAPCLPEAGLTIGPDGAFYGTTTAVVGTDNSGSVYRFTMADGLSVVTRFSGGGVGGNTPKAELTLGPDGNFYGINYQGGNGGAGAVFQVTPAGTVTEMFSFSDTRGKFRGSFSRTKVAVAANGTLYGTARYGSLNAVLWRYIPATKAYKVMHLFKAPRVRYGAYGLDPGDLVFGPDGALYGTLQGDGKREVGSVFRMDVKGRYKRIVDFTRFPELGNPGPAESLTVGPDNRLYGAYGSISPLSAGFIFATTTKGVMERVGVVGDYPAAAPTILADGTMMGSTVYGGPYHRGSFFRREVDGTITTLATLPTSDDVVMGTRPVAPLCFDANGGFTYARVLAGYASTAFNRYITRGIADYPVARRGADGTTTLVHQFKDYDAAGGYFYYFSGDYEPRISQGSDGTFYGVNPVAYGGVFSFLADGSATKLIDFTGSGGSAPGSSALAAPTEGPDGALYGTASYGGSSYNGVIYRLTKTGTYTALYQFPSSAKPEHELTLGPDGNFYGSTRYGAKSVGSLFKITPAGVFTSLVTLTGASGDFKGSYPSGPMVLGADQKLYGLAENGGENNEGVLYRIDAAGTYELLVEFGAANVAGARPYGALAIAADGAVYGTTRGGGSLGCGIVFRWTSTGGLETVMEFTGRGDQPRSGLDADGLQFGPDGDLYGVTRGGGPSNAGTIYRLHFGPQPITGSVANVTLASARLSGSINPNGVAVDLAFEYGLTEALGQSVDAGTVAAEAGVLSVEAALNGLTQGTTYYYRLRAIPTLGGATQYGAVQSFTTLSPGSPTVTTGVVSDVTLTGATVAGTVNPNGVTTTASFEYGLDLSYGMSGSVTVTPDDGVQPVNVQLPITGFASGVVVHYRLVATNSLGTSYGADATFTTGAIAPIVGTGGTSGLTATGVTLEGSVNPNGTVTSASFQYGLTTSYDEVISVEPPPGTGSASVPVSASITGLIPNATYHYRLVAVNAGGQSVGSDATFTTQEGAPVVETKPAYGTSQSTAILAGTVNPNGSVTTAEFRYGLTPALGSVAATSPTPGNGRGVVNVQAALGQLAPNSHYYFQLVATNPGGTTEGAVKEFFTTLDGGGTGGGSGNLVAQDDTFFVGADEIDLPVLANDAAPNLVPDLRIASFQTATRGTVSADAAKTKLIYVPGTSITVEDPRDTFTYTARDPGTNTGVATVNVYYFLGLQGTYEGSLTTNDGAASGSLTATLNSAGSVTATLNWQAGRYSFKKSFNIYGQLDKQLTGISGSGLLFLSLRFDAATRRIVGSLTDNSGASPLVAAVALDGPPVGAPVTISNSVFTSFIAETGTVAAAAEAAPEAAPEAALDLRLRGFGFARVTIGRNKDARFAGKMPDLAPVSSGAKLLREALTGVLKYNVSQPLYQTREFTRSGRVSGNVQVGGQAAFENLLSTLDWDRPSVVRASAKTYYPNGFTTRARLTGKPITLRKRVVPDGFSDSISPNARLTISSGGLGTNILRDLDVTKTSARIVSSVNPEKVTISLNSSTAFISGTFLYPGTTKKIKFFGARAGVGESSKGTFLAPDPADGAGSVEIVPEEP